MAEGGNNFICWFSAIAMSVIIINDGNERKGGKMNVVCFGFEPLLPTKIEREKKTSAVSSYFCPRLRIPVNLSRHIHSMTYRVR